MQKSNVLWRRAWSIGAQAFGQARYIPKHYLPISARHFQSMLYESAEGIRFSVKVLVREIGLCMIV